MTAFTRLPVVTAFLALVFVACRALGAEYPAPREGSWVARDFRFHTGDVMPELRLHYRTIGAATTSTTQPQTSDTDTLVRPSGRSSNHRTTQPTAPS